MRVPPSVRRLLGLALLGGLFAACLAEPEHTNPFDPASEAFREVGAVEGRVTDRYAPFEGLPDAEVWLSPGEVGTRSDALGQFVLAEVPVGTYLLRAARDGYVAVAETVHVALGAPARRELRLNGLPTADDLSLRTVRIARWWPQTDREMLEVELDARDPDGIGDLVEAALAIPALGVRMPLAPVTGTPGQFAGAFEPAAMGVSGLDALLGLAMHAELTDGDGAVASEGPFGLTRVIGQVPVAVAPQGLEVVGPSPVLRWEPTSAPFPHTLRVTLERADAGVRSLVEQADAVDAARTTFTPQTPLAPGLYYWTVSIVDGFGNRSRSREAGFEVR